MKGRVIKVASETNTGLVELLVETVVGMKRISVPLAMYEKFNQSMGSLLNKTVELDREVVRLEKRMAQMPVVETPETCQSDNCTGIAAEALLLQ